MIDESELLALLRDAESDRVERKSSAKDIDKISEAVCAFANDLAGHGRPGVIFVGVNDDGSCAGLPITDELLRKLADIRSSGNIIPIPQITVQKHILNDCEMAVIVVEPADAPPVRYKGRVCIRVGPRRAIADAQEERTLAERRRARDLPWDLRSFPSARMEDLDLESFGGSTFRRLLILTSWSRTTGRLKSNWPHSVSSRALTIQRPLLWGCLYAQKILAGLFPGLTCSSCESMARI